jgi:alpha-L-fucosidase
MKKHLVNMLVCLALLSVVARAQYDATWDSLNRRPVPQWFDDAKFGIFIHWGVYSVPAWGPKTTYAEWYWRRMENGRTIPSAPSLDKDFWGYHQRVYGAGFNYRDFAPLFKAELFEPDQWADLFSRAGAKYVVLTAKHHEGFTLWPSAGSPNWNAGEVGPRRDLVGDLSQAVKGRGLRMGLYYSFYEWFHPDYRGQVRNDADRQSLNRYVEQHMLPQMRELVTRYQPDIFWADGELDYESEVWQAPQFLAWLYNTAPNKNDVVVNDRWGKETRSRHGGFYTLEYGKVGTVESLAAGRKWEETRGMGGSFGYNRNEDYRDYNAPTELIHLLIETVSGGGNLLLDIGPTADGRIPVFMQDRLVEIGNWLRVNGEAIYGTEAWRVTNEGRRVFYTRKGNDVYAIATFWPGRELILPEPNPTSGATARLLGYDTPLKWRVGANSMILEMPALTTAQLPCKHAYVFKLTGVE